MRHPMKDMIECAIIGTEDTPDKLPKQEIPFEDLNPQPYIPPMQPSAEYMHAKFLARGKVAEIDWARLDELREEYDASRPYPPGCQLWIIAGILSEGSATAAKLSEILTERGIAESHQPNIEKLLEQASQWGAFFSWKTSHTTEYRATKNVLRVLSRHNVPKPRRR